MTAEEAIKVIDETISDLLHTQADVLTFGGPKSLDYTDTICQWYKKRIEAFRMAREALEKTIATRPIKKAITYFCPNCHAGDAYVRYDCIVPYDHCTNCGQALKWPEHKTEIQGETKWTGSSTSQFKAG